MNMNVSKLYQSFTLMGILFFSVSCSSDKSSQETTQTNGTTQTEQSQAAQQGGGESGVGPFQNVNISPNLDQALVDQGKTLFESRCVACHQFEDRYVGPPLGGVTERRNSDWVMNMIYNPSEMLQKDPIAKELLAEYLTPMVNMNVDEKETRAIFEYLRAHDMGQAN
jgi:mono/diheme cytochrome c family protein